MKYCCLFAVLAALNARAEGPPDLGGDGVWLPRHVANLASKTDVAFEPWSRQRFQENSAAPRSETDSRCLPPGVPRITLMPRPFQIVQTAGRILFLYEGGAHVWRQIWMDGRAHPKDPNPNWLGDSIGHWEDDTLVVDSVGFNAMTWLDDAGHPHTEQLHVIEKYTRTAPLAIKYEVEIDDPGAYTHSWKSSSTLAFRRGEKLAEDICLDKIPK
jgi:hypothetical protein